MAGLELRFLGDFAVLREGRALPLPPSKKTRALLAYLCLQPRRFRREQLCELLWEVPDDPRGSLRWSLSKLRRLVDEPSQPRVVADRTSVGIDPAGACIDVLELRALVADGLGDAPTAALEAAASRYRGNFLEGLEFSNFHDFHAWCVAERDQSLRDQAALLTELIRRADDTPERAVPHARALVGLFPYEEGNRAHPDPAAQRGAPGGRGRGAVPARPAHAQGSRRHVDGRAARRAPHAAHRRAAAAPAARPARDRRRAGAADERLVGRDDGDGADRRHPGRGAHARRVRRCCCSAARRAWARAACSRRRWRSHASRRRIVLHATAFESDSIRPFSLWTDALRALGTPVVLRRCRRRQPRPPVRRCSAT